MRMAVPSSLPRRRFPVPAALALLALAGCAVPTPYQPADNGYGYGEQQLESDRYRVTFSGNTVTPRETVQNYLLYRAAELTLAQGHDYFTVVDQSLERSTTFHGTGFGDPFWGRGRFWDRPFGPGFGNYTAYPVDSYTAFADVVMADGEKPAGEVRAYDARDVLRQLAPRIEQPDDA
jgi:hypothetical protein